VAIAEVHRLHRSESIDDLSGGREQFATAQLAAEAYNMPSKIGVARPAS
jgi:hypothetical protein